MNRKYHEEMLKEKYNALSYIKGTMRIEGHDTVCEWKCDCGKVITAKARDVIRGRKRSCTCYAFRKKENNPNWTGIGDLRGSYWNNLTNNAKSRDIKLLISQQEAWDLFLAQKKKCALTGVGLVFSSGWQAADGTASLDRIDSSKPYVKGNVQWVHKAINNMKKGLPEDAFKDWCLKVVQYSSKK